MKTSKEVDLRTHVREHPGDHAGWHAMGLSALDRGDLTLATQCLEVAIAVDATIALYHRNLGELYRRMGALQKSVLAGRRAVQLAPTDINAHYNLGLAYTDSQDYTQAEACYRRALGIDPKHNLAWNNLGSALEKQGDKSAALVAYENAIALDPKHAEAQNNAGAIYAEQGRFDAARAAFAQAVAAQPGLVEAHYNFSSLKTYTPDDPHLAQLQGLFESRLQMPAPVRIRYCFALGKALDDVGEFDRAFAAYTEGNRLQHDRLPIDEVRADALVRDIISTFDAKFFAARRQQPRASMAAAATQRTPIFIVGMPRSGTTLLEQILCSHASVHGAGELLDLHTVVAQATHAGADRSFVDGATALSATALQALGDNYLQRVWKRAPDRRYITDKMPANFFYLGLIHLALPQAKIIHAMRDPMDSCFSCYTRLFNDTMEFAYDQGTLGRYYVRYMMLMNHWRTVMPPGTILDLPYEDMVTNTETQARRVLDFVGLPWDPACLEFYKNERPVKTASVSQVRKPIYTTSVARWKRFARHLRPLYELVKDYRTDDSVPPELQLPEPGVASEQTGADDFHLRGIAHYRAGRTEAALADYDRALALRPAFAAALNSKGFALQDFDRMEEALRCFARALELAPELAMARLNLGLAQLKLGDWASGWENYEARWTGSAEAGAGMLERPSCPLPQWQGEAETAGQRLLVIIEQGFGDTFQFARYLPLAADRFAKVGFVCSPATQRLIEWSFGERILTFTRMPADFQAWDWQCPLLSLPRAFGTRPETIPAVLPTLRVSMLAAAHWRERLEATAPGRHRIGIAWAGRKAHQHDARRSLVFEQLTPLLADKRVCWVSLQKWAPEDSRPAVPTDIEWLDWTSELSDFADTAALVANLDLVISIDSAMVHLAGSLNRPVWMLNRFDGEWRWFRHREDSPWYPSLRIFNQPTFGDWRTVIDNVAAALSALDLPDVARRPQVGAGETAPCQGALPSAAPVPARAELPEAHRLHQQAIVAWQAGQGATAVDLLRQAIALNGGVALFHSNLGEMLRQQGKLDDALRHGEQAVALDPALAIAHSNLGIACFDAGDHARAVQCHQRALALAPQLLPSLNNLGSLARARKDLRAAADWYRQALAVDGAYVEALSNLGAVLTEDDQADAAEPLLLRALQQRPASPEALCNLGLVRLKQERTDECVRLMQRALQLRPSYPEALVGLARALQEQDRLSEARGLLDKACQQAPDSADAWCQLACVCLDLGESCEARRAFQRALSIDPARHDALAGLGNLRLEEGRIDEAVGLFESAIKLAPDYLGARFHLTQARRVHPGDANLAALEARVGSSEHLSRGKRIFLHYALGKAYDDLAAWDKAFPHFLEGARLKRETLVYSAAEDDARHQYLAELLDPSLIERLRGAGDPSELPLFILGMPRSGTTLVEQILASHPEVFGAGELNYLLDRVQDGSLGAFPEHLARLTRAQVTTWGAEYAARLRRHDANARRITDKMPANYLLLGLIPLLLPNARIIHVNRDPVDVCVSAFTRLFNRHQEASYDLYELGRRYASYARLMAHWRSTLPAASFLEVRYEDIVADVETQARRLVDWAGLPWHEDCLNFHTTQRSVRTASVTQVRQPIYASSVARWRHYEHYLAPLFAGLGIYAP